MTYEPGSKQCRGLIAAKESILVAMSSLREIQDSDHINTQLRNIYKE